MGARDTLEAEGLLDDDNVELGGHKSLGVADEVVGNRGRRPSVGRADAGRLNVEAVVANAVLSIGESRNDLVGSDDDDGLSASVVDSNASSRSISSNEVSLVSDSVAGHEGVVSSVGKTAEGTLLGSVGLGEDTSVQVVPLSLSLEVINETDLSLLGCEGVEGKAETSDKKTGAQVESTCTNPPNSRF